MIAIITLRYECKQLKQKKRMKRFLFVVMFMYLFEKYASGLAHNNYTCTMNKMDSILNNGTEMKKKNIIICATDNLSFTRC